MGYRSDVCIALTDSATRLMKTIISHLPEHHELRELVKMDEGTFRELRSDHLANQDLDCESKMYFEGIKWYESYEDVGLIEEILDSINEEEWLLTRVGEEMNDIDQKGGYIDSDVYVSRKIEW